MHRQMAAGAGVVSVSRYDLVRRREQPRIVQQRRALGQPRFWRRTHACDLCNRLEHLEKNKARPARSTGCAVHAVFESGLFHYGTYDSSFSHIYSAFGSTILVWQLLRMREQHGAEVRRWDPWLAGVVGWFLILFRNTNALILLFFMALVALSPSPLWARRRALVGVCIGSAVGIGIQLSYNYYASGHFSISSYPNKSFVWDRPMMRSVLFSFERGLFRLTIRRSCSCWFSASRVGRRRCSRQRCSCSCSSTLRSTAIGIAGIWGAVSGTGIRRTGALDDPCLWPRTRGYWRSNTSALDPGRRLAGTVHPPPGDARILAREFSFREGRRSGLLGAPFWWFIRVVSDCGSR